jgi:hypothetical protein
MNPSGNFPKNSLFFVVFVAKPKNIVIFAFTYGLESFALFLAISAGKHIVLTVMKR